MIPDTAAGYGGKLGQWGALASQKDRLGLLPGAHGGGGAHRSARTVLRIHIHQISLLDHPLVGDEERAYARLRSAYGVYQSLLEQQTLPYLSSRLVALHAELSRAAAEVEAKGLDDLDDDDVPRLSALYR